MTERNVSTECSCPRCQQACRYKPGWFRPEEITPAAKLLGLTEKEFFDKHLGVDYWVSEPDVFLLAPATTTMSPGQEYPRDPRGACVFFKNGLCDIHAAKPYECRTLDCSTSKATVDQRHRKTAEAWNNPEARELIRQLLGREPISSGGLSFFDLR